MKGNENNDQKVGELGEKLARDIYVGTKFGYLTAIGTKKVQVKTYMETRILCMCSCGKERLVVASYLRKGHAKCCGCGDGEPLNGRIRVHRGVFVGDKFNRWTVIGKIEEKTKDGNTQAIVRCDCGAERVVPARDLKRGNTKSCGCLMIDVNTKRMTRHGIARGTYHHSAYHSIIARCYNPNNPGYKNYGARGIKMCERWRGSIEKFVLDIGDRPGPEYSIERINNDGPYCHLNTKWATQAKQCRNKRTNRWIEFEGVNMVITDWAKFIKKSPGTIDHRIKRRGMSDQEALAAKTRDGSAIICGPNDIADLREKLLKSGLLKD